MRGAKHLRPTRARKHEIASRRASRTLAGLVALICLPVIAVVLLIFRTTGPDLFDLVPKVSRADGYVLLAWYDLERSHHALKEGGLSADTPTLALGYMMESDQPIPDGQPVGRFVLLPDAGNAVHPAHRFGDQMIEVRLRGGDTVRFSEGSLVWVWGIWRILPGDPNGPKPLYELGNARIEPADKSDIPKYFR